MSATPRFSEEWSDCANYLYAEVSVYHGDEVWPSMLSIWWPEDGTITSDDARQMAALLTRAADACDQSTDETRRGS